MKLETQNISLSKVLSTIKYDQKNGSEWRIGVEVFQTFNYVLKKKSGLKAILKISKILTGKETSMKGLPNNLTGDDITFFYMY
jgi:hypothetical protein